MVGATICARDSSLHRHGLRLQRVLAALSYAIGIDHQVACPNMSLIQRRISNVFSHRLLSTVSGHSTINIDLLLSAKSGRWHFKTIYFSTLEKISREDHK